MLFRGVSSQPPLRTLLRAAEPTSGESPPYEGAAHCVAAPPDRKSLPYPLTPDNRFAPKALSQCLAALL